MIDKLFSMDVSWWVLLVQSTLCMVLGLLGSFLLRRQAARAHQALMLGMLGSLLVPFLSVAVKYYGWGLLQAESQTSEVVLGKATDDVTMVIKPMAKASVVRPIVPDGARSFSPAPFRSSLALQPGPGPSAPKVDLPTVTGDASVTVSWPYLLVGIWALLSLLLLLRLIRTFILGIRLLRTAQALDNIKLQEALYCACAKLGVRHTIDIRVSQTVHSPIIWCWGVRPILLVPTGTEHLTRHTDWLGLFCHEVAHWKRRDHVVGLGTELAVSLIWWHPLVWWAKQRLLFLSEQACDDWVLASGQAGPDYAESLLTLLPEGRMAFVPTVVGKENTMKARIHRIIKHQVSNPRVGWRWALLALLITSTIAVGTALAQRRPARVDQQKQKDEQARQEELLETIHYLETRIKVNEMEIQNLEKNGRGQGIKARILRDEVRRTREQLRELRPITKERKVLRKRRETTRAEELSNPFREREALAKHAQKLEQALREAREEGRPHATETAHRDLVEVHEHLQQLNHEAHQDVHVAHQAEHQVHQKARQAHLQDLSREREKLAQKAQQLEHRLQELGDRDPDLQEALHRALDEMRKQLDQVGTSLEDHDLDLFDKQMHEPVVAHDRLQEVRGLEQMAKRYSSELKILQETARYDEARAQQKRLQEVHEQLAQVREYDFSPRKAKEKQDTIREVRKILKDEIRQRENEFEALPEDRDEEAGQLRATLDILVSRLNELPVPEQERPIDMDMMMSVPPAPPLPGERRLSALDEDPSGDDTMMSLAPPSPLPGERPGAGLQHQVRDLHGRMDELTGQMQELRHLLQQLLEQQQQKLPSLYDMSDIAEDESTPPSTESF
jgi:beta-lactamase regulating signal transducer with metallopeptidase domain